jgi:pyridoxal phosphate enzyme (YggS family)
MSRREELAARLEQVRRRIADACEAAGRVDDVTLIAVTKTFPASDVALLAELGQLDVGENRDQEARAKWAELHGHGIRWHMIGQVQRNKAKSVAAWADVVHSVDRQELATALSSAALDAGRELEVMVQVCLDSDADDPGRTRGGVAPRRALALADAVHELPGLRLGGVMGVAPVDGAEQGFSELERVAALIREHHPLAKQISAGMSQDLDIAIRHGATQVRIGAALLGNRGDLQ